MDELEELFKPQISENS